MNFDKAIEKCKANMYYIYKRYSIDGYDSDDLFQETVIWIMRDWNKIITLDECEISTAIISRAKWICDHLSNRNNKPITTQLNEDTYHYDMPEFNEYDMAHLMIRAKKRLSKCAFDVLSLKLMRDESPSRREIQEMLKITNRPYDTAINQIREFMNDEDIRPNN